MKLSPENIVNVARGYLDTPWHHCGRVKGVGIDCAGLLVLVSREFKLQVEDDTSYSQGDEYERMVANLEGNCYRLPQTAQLQAGDILVFRDNNMPNHCGIYNGEGGMIHAFNSPSVHKVVEHSLNQRWWNKLVGAYRYKGL